jgi:hypothetical protein
MLPLIPEETNPVGLLSLVPVAVMVPVPEAIAAKPAVSGADSGGIVNGTLLSIVPLI